VLEVKCVLKPGIAGCAPLSYLCSASEADRGEQLKYDLFHVKNHHPLLELLVLTQTVEVFFLDVVNASNVLKIASAIAMRGACHVPN
jgi:lipopolysaccharide/colanic/teichoic acid biosynthesis glycosyltransferase